MLDNVVIVLCFVGLLLGAVLLHDGISKLDVNESAKVVGGGVLVSLSATTTWLLVRSKLERWRDYKKYREE